MLVIQNVSKRYGSKAAVSAVSLEIEAGSFVGVIGRSGAGKSTLLRMINRLVDPSDGRISFEGCDVTALRGRELREWRAKAAMIFQQFNLVGRLDVLTNVLIGRISRHGTIPALLSRFTESERARAVESLERLDLLAHAFQRADSLSGGQQQRVAIARALMQEPSIVLADEPIASLDPRNAARVMESLKRINEEDGITVLCNLHTLDTARQFSSRIIGLAHGQVVFDGAPDELSPAILRDIYDVPGQIADAAEEIPTTADWYPERGVAAA
jgi:phosphonate transport system ATP-binding protein